MNNFKFSNTNYITQIWNRIFSSFSFHKKLVRLNFKSKTRNIKRWDKIQYIKSSSEDLMICPLCFLVAEW